MNLYVAGVVPGTHDVLTPGQEFWMLGALLFIAVAAIFFTNIKRSILRLVHRTPQTLQVSNAVAKTPKPAKPAKAPKPKVILVLPIKTKNSRLVPYARRIIYYMQTVGRRILALAGPRVEKVLHFAGAVSRSASAAVSIKTQRTCVAVIAYATFFAERLVRLSIRSAEVTRFFVAAKAILIWRWAEPRIHDFDRYLNRRLHQNETAAAVLAFGSQSYELCRDWVTVLVARLERALQK
ncbi:MAG TPA: hypothetical protein VLH84_03810 [Patescibacteria group bacterium]|nr:hypothetical protein [Patescibacteria group bacterium]